jgi:hypothetical protein
MACHRLDVPVVTDDVLIVADGLAFAGPRCLDLRDPVDDAIALRGDRYRVTLDPMTAEVPLRGFVHLGWDAGAHSPLMRRLPPSERLERLLHPGRGDTRWHDGVARLELAALPAWELTRPREGDVDASTELLIDILNER